MLLCWWMCHLHKSSNRYSHILGKTLCMCMYFISSCSFLVIVFRLCLIFDLVGVFFFAYWLFRNVLLCVIVQKIQVEEMQHNNFAICVQLCDYPG